MKLNRFFLKNKEFTFCSKLVSEKTPLTYYGVRKQKFFLKNNEKLKYFDFTPNKCSLLFYISFLSVLIGEREKLVTLKNFVLFV